jgi:glucan phosphoethanolaminetransferase (alkaline phosphatase superfamily)
MIQRIQTIWLLLSAFFSGLLINGGIVNFIDKSGQKFYTGFFGIYKQFDTGNELIRSSIPLAALIILISLLSLITIFLYKSRRIQRVLSLILLSLSLCLIILVTFYSYILVKNYGADLVPGVKMVFPVLVLIAVILAYIGIIRDDRLVKSYDRLR